MSMLCKIVDDEDEAEPILWRNLNGEQPTAAMSQPAGRSQSPLPKPSVDNSRLLNGPATAKQLRKPGEPVGQMAQLQARIAQMEAQREVELSQARQSGVEQGRHQAREEAASEMQAALDRMARNIQEVAQIKKKVRHDAETQLVKLSLAIAKRILHREVSADPQSIRGIVYAALENLKSREVSRIRVFPAAVQAVRSALERNGGLAAMEIISDPHLPVGGILFETALGELDASVDTQLQEIERGFADRLRG